MRFPSAVIAAATLALPLLASSPLFAVDSLGDILRESKWDRIVGTWVDADTEGAALKVTYAWKIQDRVMEVTTKQGTTEHAALMGVNAKTGEVFHMSASSDGGSALGKWELEDNGDAVLGLVFTGGDGQEGAVNIRHHLEDDDSMITTIELAEPLKIKMVRAQAKK